MSFISWLTSIFGKICGSIPQTPTPNNETKPTTPAKPMEATVNNGKRYAILAGSNFVGTPSELKGCINDLKDVRAMIEGSGIEIIADMRDADMTANNWKAALTRAAALAQPGDTVFHMHSHHGTQIKDPSEADGLAEAWCSNDFDWSPQRMITDKWMANLITSLKPGVVWLEWADCCLSGETKIPLLDGTEATIKELCNRQEPFWVYSCTPDGTIVAGKAHSARITGKRELLRITLDDNSWIECTEDHPFLMRDGSYKNAGDLLPQDSLMPLYRKLGETGYLKGYEMVHNLTGRRKWLPTHLAVRDSVGMKIQGSDKTVCHHKNFNKRDNTPENLEMVSWTDHKKMHGAVGRANLLTTWSRKEYRVWRASDEYRKAQSETTKAGWKNPTNRARHHAGQMAMIREQGQPSGFVAYNSSPENRENIRKRNLNPTFSAKRIAGIKALFSDPVRVTQLKEFRALVTDGVVDRNKTPFKQWVLERDSVPNNHKVQSVEKSGKIEEVYDLTVDVHHNFALSSGVFVHNCHAGDSVRDLWCPSEKPRYIVNPDLRDFHAAKLAPMVVAGTDRNGILLAACRSAQTSADAFEGGKSCGAFSFFMLKALKETPGATYEDLLLRVTQLLGLGGYDQKPELDCKPGDEHRTFAFDVMGKG